MLIWLSGLGSVLSGFFWKVSLGDSPDGPVVKNLPSNVEDAGSIPGQGTKIPGAAELLSQSTTTKTQFNQINKYFF